MSRSIAALMFVTAASLLPADPPDSGTAPADAPKRGLSPGTEPGSPSRRRAEFRLSIQRYEDDWPNSYAISGGSFTFAGLPLRDVIAQAFDTSPTRVDGPADVLDQQLTVAFEPGNVEMEVANGILRHVLCATFDLEFDHDSQVVDTWVLTIRDDARERLVRGRGPSGGMAIDREGRLTAKGMAMKELADWFAQMVNAPVLDETGVTGRYDLALTIDAAVEPAAALPAALSKQVGLELKQERREIDVVVVKKRGVD